MPSRKRSREFRRRLRKAVEQAEAEVKMQEAQAILASASVNPLDDAFWDEHENPYNYLCSCHQDQSPRAILEDARQEINAYLNRGGSHERQQ